MAADGGTDEPYLFMPAATIYYIFREGWTPFTSNVTIVGTFQDNCLAMIVLHT